MKLYWGPRTCAIGIHILLEEVKQPYGLEKLDVAGGDTEKPAFLAINPKGKVPILVRDDGSVITEFGAIAGWLAMTYPAANLLPTDPENHMRVREAMDYAVATIHGQGFARIFMPAKFEPQDMVHKMGLGAGSVKDQGREIVKNGFAILSVQLGSKRFVDGDDFSIADAALFYLERWAPQTEIQLPSNLLEHFVRVRDRPSTRKVMEIWGEE